MEQVRRRRLAVRPGDPDDLELGRRVAEELDGGDRHRAPRVVDDELRDVDVERPFYDERGGTALDRVGREVVPVESSAGHAEEQCARPHRPRVVGEVGQLDRSAPDHVLRCERRDHALQLHLGGRV